MNVTNFGLTPSEKQAHELRERRLSYAEIGARMGIGKERAAFLTKRAHIKIARKLFGPSWTDGLHVRVANSLCNAGYQNREEVHQAYLDGTLWLRSKRPRNYGQWSHAHVGRWLDLSNEEND